MEEHVRAEARTVRLLDLGPRDRTPPVPGPIVCEASDACIEAARRGSSDRATWAAAFEVVAVAAPVLLRGGALEAFEQALAALLPAAALDEPGSRLLSRVLLGALEGLVDPLVERPGPGMHLSRALGGALDVDLLVDGSAEELLAVAGRIAGARAGDDGCEAARARLALGSVVLLVGGGRRERSLALVSPLLQDLPFPGERS
ncbi:MAG: hypothetical protein HY815_03250, partial [Candidatus Riflebacteria bacterium]|nr:hypothetical protein [Candidatus Riflebacteria bacterium]